MKKINNKKLNNKGFAVSVILYIAATIVVLVLFLILSILSTNSKNKDNIVDNIKENVSGIEDNKTVASLGKISIIASDGKASGSWHNEDFTLTFSRPIEDGVVVNYPIVYYYGTSNSSINNKVIDDQIAITESTYSTTYYVKACRSGSTDVCSEISSYEVKIDKDIPTLSVVGSSTTWAQSRKLTIKSDSPSGISYYEYFIFDNENDYIPNYDLDDIYTSYENEIIVTGTGKFISIRAVNKVGHKGDWQMFNLYIDSSVPDIPTITSDDGKISGEWHPKTVRLNLESSYSISGLDYYYSITSKKPSEINTLATYDSNTYRSYIDFSQTTLDTDVAVIACNKAKVCSDVKVYRLRIDTATPGAPTVSGGNTTWTTDAKEFTLTSNASSISGVAYYEYYISASSGTPSTTTEATSRFTGNTISISTPGKFIFFREVSNAGNKSAWTTYKNLYINAVNIPNPTITATDGKTSGEWHVADVTLNLTDSLTTIPLTYYYGTSENTLNSLGTSTKLTYSNNTPGITYYIKVCQTNDSTICSSITTYTVKLDKSVPTIAVANTSTSWTNTKTLIITPTATSGVHHYEYAITNSTPSDDAEGIVTFNDTNLTINNSGKLIYIRAINNLGVSGAWKQFNLYVDSSVPNSPTITSNDNLESGSWHLANTTLYSSDSTALSGIDYYYSITSDTYDDTYKKMAVSSGKYYVTHSTNTDGVTYYIVACNRANTMTCSASTKYILKLDKSTLTVPKVESGGNTTWTTDSQIFTLSSTTIPFSGFSHYEYYLSTSTTNPATTVDATGSFSTNEITITKPGQYVYFREVNNAGGKSAWTTYKKLYIDSSIPAPIITANDNIISGDWHTTNTTLAFSNELKTIPLTYYYGTTIEDVNNFKTAGVSVSVTVNTASTTYYVKACRSDSNKQNCSEITSYELKLDKSIPTIAVTGTSTTWSPSRTLSITPTATSGIKHYEYYLSDTTTTPAADVTEGVVKFTNSSLEITTPNIYIYLRAVNNIDVKGTWVRYNLYVDSKIPEIPTITAGDGIDSGSWHSKPTSLTFSGASSLSGITYHFYRTDDTTDRTGATIASTANGLNVNTASRIYYVKACNKSNLCSEEIEYEYKLDQTKPAAPTVDNGGTNWTIDGRDFTLTPPTSVSGIDHYEYYISTSTTTPATTVEISGVFNSSTVTITNSGKFIFFRAVNKIGVVGAWTTYRNLYVDNNAILSPTITSGDTIVSGQWHSKATSLTFSGSNSASGITYYYGTSEEGELTAGTSIAATSNLLKDNTADTTIYVKACNQAKICSAFSKYVYKLDKQTLGKPTVEGGSDTWTTSGKTFTITSTTTTVPVSGIKGYEYYISTSTTAPAATVEVTGFTENNSVTITKAGQYIYFREVSNVGTKSSWSAVSNLYVEYTNYPLPQITASDSVLSGAWHTTTSNITLTFDASITTIPVTYYYYTSDSATLIAGKSKTISNTTLDTTYYVKVCRTGSDVCSDISSYNLKIDKTAPSITIADSTGINLTTWATSKTLVITPTSFSGIEYYEYYLSDSTTAPTDDDTEIVAWVENELTITESHLYIYFKITDKAGKTTSWARFNLYVDSSVPDNPTITATDGIASNKWHIANTTLNFKTDSTALSGIIYKYYTSENATEYTASSKAITTNTGNSGIIYYVKACTNAGLCSDESSYVLKIDKTTVNAPTVTVGITGWTADEKLFTLKQPTGVVASSYEYYISSSKDAPSYTQEATGKFTGETVSIGQSGTYIFFRVVLESGRAGNWSTASNLYINTAFLSNLVVDNYDLSPEFSNNTVLYTLTVPYDVEKLNIDATPSNTFTKVNITGNEKLVVGENKIYIETISNDSTATYAITVTREEDTTNTLSSLAVGEYKLEPDFDPNINEYTVTVEGLSTINISAIGSKDTLSIFGIGEQTLAIGENIFSVTVTAASGDINTYTIKVINNKVTE